MLTSYDPNIRWARHTFELTFMRWDYQLIVEVDVCGNCKGFSLFDSALRTVFEENYDDDDEYAQLTLKRPSPDGKGDDTLEVDLYDDSDLEDICVGIRIVKHIEESK